MEKEGESKTNIAGDLESEYILIQYITEDAMFYWT